MNVIVSEPQLNLFLRRRFSPSELDFLLNNAKDLIDEHGMFGVYDAVRELIKSKKFSDIDEFGDDDSFWHSYLVYEKPLIAFVKSKLNLELLI